MTVAFTVAGRRPAANMQPRYGKRNCSCPGRPLKWTFKNQTLGDAVPCTLGRKICKAGLPGELCGFCIRHCPKGLACPPPAAAAATAQSALQAAAAPRPNRAAARACNAEIAACAVREADVDDGWLYKFSYPVVGNFNSISLTALCGSLCVLWGAPG